MHNPYKKSGPGCGTGCVWNPRNGTVGVVRIELLTEYHGKKWYGEVARYDTSYVMAPSFHGMIRVEGGTCWLVSRRAKDQYTIFLKKLRYLIISLMKLLWVS